MRPYKMNRDEERRLVVRATALWMQVWHSFHSRQLAGDSVRKFCLDAGCNEAFAILLVRDIDEALQFKELRQVEVR